MQQSPNPEDVTWYELSYTETQLGVGPLEERETGAIDIVGRGLAGLSLALSLAERGTSAILLEARTLGARASGRNGGLLSVGFTLGFAVLCGRLPSTIWRPGSILVRSAGSAAPQCRRAESFLRSPA
jgi:hypothetical protein